MSRIPAMFVVGLAYAAAACGTDSDTGSVDVTTVSSGQDVDTDGYVVEVAGAGTISIASNGAASFPEVPAGEHEVRLTAVRGNCRVQRAHPRVIRVVAGQAFQLHFEVACARAPLLGRMVISQARGDSSQIYEMSPDGSSQRRLTRSEDWEDSPSVSPDGTRILFIARDREVFDGDVYVMNADGSGRTALTRDDAGDGDPAWSPDGSQIAYISDLRDFGDSDIWVMNPDGTARVNITRSTGLRETAPAWSPDGRRILFMGMTDEGQVDYYMINPDGTGGTRITSDSTPKGVPTWAPDGARIAFIGFAPEGGFDLNMMDASGANRVTVTTLPGFAGSPSWSTDGSRIAFPYRPPTAPQLDLYTIYPDGTRLTNISNTLDASEGIGARPWGP